jgi:hypothetical protein
MTELWPWLAIAGLGAFHGVNPAMGWLFAVALGLHRQSRRVVLTALAPLALGHAVSVGLVAAAALLLGLVMAPPAIMLGGGGLLIAWALFHALYGQRRRVTVGMQTGLTGLAVWSFLMATAHGAGLMLLPAVMPLCLGAAAPRTGSAWIGLLAVGLHTLAMLAITGAIAIVVFHWLGVGFLRRGWINFDLLWTLALLATGGLMIAGWP